MLNLTLVGNLHSCLLYSQLMLTTKTNELKLTLQIKQISQLVCYVAHDSNDMTPNDESCL